PDRCHDHHGRADHDLYARRGRGALRPEPAYWRCPGDPAGRTDRRGCPMIRRLLPFPLLTLALILLWLLLQQSLALGQILLGTAIAIFAARTFAALDPERARVRRIGSIIQLVALVTADIVRSNIAVASIIVQGRHH